MLLEQSNLRELLAKLPEGLQTKLGEGGALVSGGEGQRVRLARAMLKPDVRLAILDEPFRGLDRRQRRDLLTRARKHWQEVTLLCITHDVSETLAFPRVLVMEKGRIVESGLPAQLAGVAGSRYRTMLEAEGSVRKDLWSSSDWRPGRSTARAVRGRCARGGGRARGRCTAWPECCVRGGLAAGTLALDPLVAFYLPVLVVGEFQQQVLRSLVHVPPSE